MDSEKQGKTISQTFTKKCSSSLYGGCVRKDIEECYECVTQNSMKNEHDDFVVEWLPLKNGKIMVKTKDREGVDDGGISKKINSQLCHLGSFILFHSKGLKIVVILALDSFRNNKTSYEDNDTEYINNYYQILKTKDFFAENLYQAKNEYGKGAVLNGLFRAPQFKYCIVIDENGILSQKQLSKDMIKLLWD